MTFPLRAHVPFFQISTIFLLLLRKESKYQYAGRTKKIWLSYNSLFWGGHHSHCSVSLFFVIQAENYLRGRSSATASSDGKEIFI